MTSSLSCLEQVSSISVYGLIIGSILPGVSNVRESIPFQVGSGSFSMTAVPRTSLISLIDSPLARRCATWISGRSALP